MSCGSGSTSRTFSWRRSARRLRADPLLLLVAGSEGRLQRDGVAEDHEHDLAVRGLVGPALHRAELENIGGLAERLLELGAGVRPVRLLDDVLLRLPAAR